ncbi:DeoR/GlpR family DNA-binding transcription regulator [Streptomyces hygroscopicus]|uniref:DeoR/GlpR family DNA-binding transcription regulator n=1 Tax=Streptomyces hygroscopicus TaxID=1912 RepID=UPI0033E35F4E
MYATERQQEIMRYATAAGRVEVAQLARDLRVTAETVRKDLNALQQLGLLRRVHGGAVPVNQLLAEPEVAARTEWTEEKKRIAKAALAELPPQGSVFIESGSTTALLAEQLPPDLQLIVYTNSLPVAMMLAPRPQLTVITLGGRVRAVTLGEVDNFALRSLREINVDVAFLGANGISLERGLTTPDAAEAEVKRQILRSARRRVLLVDRTKIGEAALWRYGELSDIEVLITNDLDAEQSAALNAAGPHVVVV